MWKYVSRRIRDTFERSANHFDKRSTTNVVNNSPANLNEEKNKRVKPPCCWISSQKCWSSSQKCWSSSQNENDTNSKKWNFEHLNKTWIGAITWSSALVVGWYTSQLVHLKLKCQLKDKQKCASINNLISYLQPYVPCVNKDALHFKSASKIENIINTFTPPVHLISNDRKGGNKEAASVSGSTTSPDTSDDDLGDVLNSIENRLGLAAIEKGLHQDGLNLLRSAANRHHPPALYNLGLCYEIGLGVSIDEKMAMEFYRSAAALEHPGALYNLGIYYGQGRGGLHRDTQTATRLLRLAAVQGHRDAIDALKTLDVDETETPTNETESWTYSHTLFLQDDSIVPTQSALFVENVNFLQNNKCETVAY